VTEVTLSYPKAWLFLWLIIIVFTLGGFILGSIRSRNDFPNVEGVIGGFLGLKKNR